MSKILIIDDEIEVCNTLKEFLTQKDYEVSVAHNDKDGFALFKTIAPDLVFLELDLPTRGGLLLLGYIKAIKFYAKVIMMSANGTYTNVKLATKKGAMDFLVKPLDMGNIELKIKNALQS
ncbi:MAG: response regulator [bacterium]|nr:response regulator [bacterium]